MSEKRILVAGGAGYIGSHVCVELIEAGYDLLIIDNFSNSHPAAIDRVKQITKINDPTRIHLLEADLADPAHKNKIIDNIAAFKPTGAIHLAGLKAVGESVAKPDLYYRVNIDATFTLIEALKKVDARQLVFSSSATVYGDLNESPVDETGNTGPTNPYGHTKLMIEQILTDLTKSPNADTPWHICNLRYFNPVGAHASGLIGEDPNDIPNNLFPFIAQVAVGRLEHLQIFGEDYPTPDGTGVRDYIHVCDLAHGHLKALEFIQRPANSGAHIFNLGTGNGCSVKEVVDYFAKASGQQIPYQIAPRREGDIAQIYANSTKANETLGWQATKSLADMCADHWHWQVENPNGYRSS